MQWQMSFTGPEEKWHEFADYETQDNEKRIFLKWIHILSFASTSADKNLPYTPLKKNISNFDYSESTYLIKNDSKVVTFRMYISITHLHRYVCSKGDNFLKKGEFPKLSSQKVHINYNPY